MVSLQRTLIRKNLGSGTRLHLIRSIERKNNLSSELALRGGHLLVRLNHSPKGTGRTAQPGARICFTNGTLIDKNDINRQATA